MPAVIYGAKQAATLIALDPRDVLRELVRGGWRSRVYQVNSGGEPSRTLMREVQFHPVNDKPMHVDFQRLAPGERIRLGVSVQFRGDTTSPGIKKGGVLNVVRHTVEVMADPDTVPEAFIADLAALDINDNVRFSDLSGTEGCDPVITGRDFVIATVAAPTKLAEAAAEPGAGAPTAAATPAKGGGKTTAPSAKAPVKAAPKPAAKK